MKPKLTSDVINLSENDFLRLPQKEIFARIKASLAKPENKIGRGGEAEVWKIEGTDYCMRIPHDSWGKYKAKPVFNLSEEDKVNHTVAKLANGVTIMPIIKGHTFFSDKVSNDEVQKMIENMPQESFDKLFKQIYHAEKIGCYFDNGFKNIIINPEEKTLTAIDFYKTENIDFQKDILNKLFSTLNLPDSSMDYSKKLAAKLLSAPLNIIQNEPKLDIDLEYCGFRDFVNRLKRNNIIESQNYAKILKDNLREIVRLNYLKEDSQKALLLGYHQMVTKTLIKQLLLNK